MPDLAPILTLTDVTTLAERTSVVFVDCRHYLDGRSGVEAFEQGHLRGAVHVDLDRDLCRTADASAGRHPLATSEHFASRLGALGIADTDTVVAYDDAGGAIAARLVWMLRIIGAPAALLDGGIGAWPHHLEVGPAAPRQPVLRTPVAWPSDATADAADVLHALRAGETVIDSRAAPRFRGEVEPIDPVGGHIPGAINRPFADNINEDKRFVDHDQLAERWTDLGPRPIVYCGSGVTACHNALVMESVGLGRPRLYVGSWSGWSSDPTRPVATGDESA